MSDKSRPYRIVRRPRGVFFVCVDCNHEIDVNSFPKLRWPGPAPRTLAAAAMKAHRDSCPKVTPIPRA